MNIQKNQRENVLKIKKDQHHFEQNISVIKTLCKFIVMAGLIGVIAGCGGGGGSGTTSTQTDSSSSTDPDGFVSAAVAVAPAAQAVNTPQSARHQNVTLSFNTSGNGIAVWETGKEYGLKLVYSFYDATSGTWGSEEVLASVAEAYSLTTFSYSVASNASGFAVIWEAHAGTNDDHLYARVYSNGVWSAIKRIDNVDTTFVYTHKLAAAADGYLVVWEQNQKIYSSAYANGAWAAPGLSPAPSNSRALGLASNGSGYLMAYCTFVYSSCTGAVSSAAFTGSWGQPVVADTSTVGTAQVEIASSGSNYLMIMDDSGLYSSFYSGSAWSAPVLLASAAYLPHVKSNGSGYAVAYSTASYYSSGGIYTNQFDGSAWGGPQLVESASAGTVSNLVLASNSADYGVSWRSLSGGIQDFRAAVISSGTPQAAVAVEGSAQMVTYAAMAGGGSGFALAWVQYDGAATEKVYTRTLNNTTLSAQNSLLTKPHDSPAASALFAINASGQRVAVWTQEYFDPAYDPAYPTSLYTSGLFASVYNAGTWGTAQLLMKYGVDPIIVSDGSSFLVAYNTVSSPGGSLYANVYKNGSWGAAKNLGGTVYDRFVSNNGNGYAVVWEQNTAGNWGIYAHIFDETTGWDASNTRLDNTTSSAYLSRPASNGSGYAVAWSEADSSQPLYNYASVYDSGSKVWTRTLMVESSISSAAVASNGTGYALAWYDITAASVLARVFESGVWQAAVRLDTGSPASPYLESNGTGYAAIWGGYPSLYANVFNGTSWSGEQTLAQNSVSVMAKLVANSQGYLAYWVVNDLNGSFLYGLTHNGTQWQTSATLLGQDVTPKAVVGNGAGYGMVWLDTHLGQDHSDLGYRIYNGTDWLPGALLENSNIPLPFFLDVDLARDGTGYAAVWVQAHDGYDDPAVKKVWHTTLTP